MKTPEEIQAWIVQRLTALTKLKGRPQAIKQAYQDFGSYLVLKELLRFIESK